MDKEFVKDLCNNGLEYMFIGSLISADNINSEEDAKNSLKYLSEFEEALKDSDLDQSKKDELDKFITKSKEILDLN